MLYSTTHQLSQFLPVLHNSLFCATMGVVFWAEVELRQNGKGAASTRKCANRAANRELSHIIFLSKSCAAYGVCATCPTQSGLGNVYDSIQSILGHIQAIGHFGIKVSESASSANSDVLFADSHVVPFVAEKFSHKEHKGFTKGTKSNRILHAFAEKEAIV